MANPHEIPATDADQVRQYDLQLQRMASTLGRLLADVREMRRMLASAIASAPVVDQPRATTKTAQPRPPRRKVG